MNIENIAIVRATDIIPIDGKIIPVSEAKYIKKSKNIPLAEGIKNLLKREGLITPIDFSRLEDTQYMEEKNKEIDSITSKYIPYTSSYNSMVLFSLNGIVPDDKEAGFGNNTFSNKKCAIIDSLSSHIDDVISLNPTDTAIKGNVTLSSDGIILIEKNVYENLSNIDKNKLRRFYVKLFEGSLKEAIESYLKNSQRYTCEKLALSSSKGGYLDSPTSEQLKQTIKKIAEEKQISTAYHLNILLHNTDANDKLKSVEKEHENILKIREYYQNEFYKFLFSEMPVNEELQYYLLNYNSDIYIDKLCEVIQKFGLQNYKKICDKFNSTLELLKNINYLPSPQEIIESINKSIPIDLCKMIREFNLENYEKARQNYQSDELNKIMNIQSIKEAEMKKGKSI